MPMASDESSCVEEHGRDIPGLEFHVDCPNPSIIQCISLTDIESLPSPPFASLSCHIHGGDELRASSRPSRTTSRVRRRLLQSSNPVLGFCGVVVSLQRRYLFFFKGLRWLFSSSFLASSISRRPLARLSRQYGPLSQILGTSTRGPF